jgi:NADPH-dependent curcumin reductase CurA
MFITKNGTIDFEEDPSTYCQAPQVVKGIFVAGNGFTTSKIRNDNLNKSWCTYGNLQVKGILVGAGIDTLVENRRSNLNRWFRAGGSDESQRIQRRNQIFNGASLLIEYSPELWAQLPPGADQFVNLLDVYKK